jgi:inorganic triphosphatase YgiF
MRARNGLVSFSDYMNAYHEKMEEVLLREDKSLTQPALGVLREQAAVLSYLAKVVERNASAKLKSDSAFMQALSTLDKSVSALLEATRSGDASATQRAIEGLKPAYSRLFLRFG